MAENSTGIPLSAELCERIDKTVACYADAKNPLLEVLREIQSYTGYISNEVLVYVSRKLDVSVARAYGVATFYSLLSTTQKGDHIVRVCVSAPCFVQGSDKVLQAARDSLGIDVGQTTPDNQFTLETTSCLGVCSAGPAMMVDDRIYGNLTYEKVQGILRDYMKEEATS